MKQSFSAKGLAFCGIGIALAYVLSFIKLFDLPLGGSITLCSMFFISVIGYILGPKYSLCAAFAYGLLQLLQDPQIYAPMQFVVDYIFAFTSLGLSGFFRHKKNSLYIGYLVAITARFLFSSFSGYVFFAEYAPSDWNPLVYSVCYNGAYIYLEGLITIIIISLPPIRKAINQVKKLVA